MKSTFNLLAALLFLIPQSAGAQDEVRKAGFFRIVNAVAPGTGNLFIKINGRELHEKGYREAQYSGGIGIGAGDHEITVEKAGVRSGTTRFQVEPGETLSLVAFAVRLEPDGDAEDGEPPPWGIRILRLKQQQVETGYRVSFVSVCEPEELGVQAAIHGRNEPAVVTLKRLDMRSVDLGERRLKVVVRHHGKKIAEVSPDSPGNYVVILYQDSGGEVRALSFHDPKFVIAG